MHEMKMKVKVGHVVLSRAANKVLCGSVSPGGRGTQAPLLRDHTNAMMLSLTRSLREQGCRAAPARPPQLTRGVSVAAPMPCSEQSVRLLPGGGLTVR